MRDWVSEWKQEGGIFVWRYAEPNRSWRGWHFTADRAGCRSIRNLLDRMHGGEPCYRTLNLAPVTGDILSVPNYGHKIAGKFEKLRIAFDPGADDLQLSPVGETLEMTVGNARLRFLTAAFADVEIGIGDFGIMPSTNRKADPWMFWWMATVSLPDNGKDKPK